MLVRKQSILLSIWAALIICVANNAFAFAEHSTQVDNQQNDARNSAATNALDVSSINASTNEPNKSSAAGDSPVSVTDNSLLLRPVRYDNIAIFQVHKSASTDRILNRYASKIDIWRQSKDNVKFALHPNDVRIIKNALELDGAHVETQTGAKLQQAIDQETERLRNTTRNGVRRLSIPDWIHSLTQSSSRIAQNNDWFSDFHPYNDIVVWAKNLSARFPRLVQYMPSIGRTYEGRDIPMLRITAPKSSSTKNRKRIWLQSLQHAREWISGSTLQYIAEKLASGYGEDARVTRILNEVEFVLIPVANPDGYNYTWTTDRLWRKNRRDNGDGTFGVDLNRNWPDHWNSVGIGADSASVVYPGPSAGSEPEVQALMHSYLNTPNVVAVVDIHSYSQLLLRPFGWSKTPDANERQYRTVSNQLVKDLALTHGTRYISERAIDLYKAEGIATDWWAGVGQQQRHQREVTRSSVIRPYAFTIELSPSDDDEDLGENGFILPPSAIRRVGEDVWPMILHLAEIGLTQPLVSSRTQRQEV